MSKDETAYIKRDVLTVGGSSGMPSLYGRGTSSLTIAPSAGITSWICVCSITTHPAFGVRFTHADHAMPLQALNVRPTRPRLLAKSVLLPGASAT